MKAIGTRLRHSIINLMGKPANEDDKGAAEQESDDADYEMYSEQELQRKPRGRNKRTAGKRSGAIARTIMQIVVSLSVLCVGLYVILSNQFNTDEKKWAYGVIGVVVGYWLS